MTTFDQKRLIQIVLYILNKTGGIDYYHLFKIIYFAELEHISKWGSRMTTDDLCAMEYGPVPSKLYDAVKKKNARGTKLADMLWSVAESAKDDATYVLLPKQDVDLAYLSKSDLDALDNSIEENAKLSFGKLKEKSHDAAWREAYEKQNGNNIISPISMARVTGSEWAAEQIEEQLELEAALV